MAELFVLVTEGNGAAGGCPGISGIGISTLSQRSCPWPPFCCCGGAAHTLVTGAPYLRRAGMSPLSQETQGQGLQHQGPAGPAGWVSAVPGGFQFQNAAASL